MGFGVQVRILCLEVFFCIGVYGESIGVCCEQYRCIRESIGVCGESIGVFSESIDVYYESIGECGEQYRCTW